MPGTRFEIEVQVDQGPVTNLVGTLNLLGSTGAKTAAGLTRNFSKFGGLIKGMPKALRGFVGALGTMGKVGLIASTAIAGIGIAVVGLIKAFTPAVKAAAEFEKQMTEVDTLFKDATVSIGRMNEEILGLAARSPLALSDLTAALYQTVSAGIDAAEAMGVLNEAAKAAVGGVTTIEIAVDGITSAINAWGLAASEAQNVSDAFFIAVRNGKTDFEQLSRTIGGVAPVAAAVGVSLEEVLAAVTTLTQSGVRTSEAMTQVRSLLVAIARQVPQTQKVADQLGLSFNVTALRAKGLAKFIQDATEAVRGNESAATRLVGRIEAMQALMLLGGTGAASFADNLMDMENSAGAADRAFGKMNSTLLNTVDRLKNKFNVILVELGNKLLPAVTKSLVSLDAVMQGFLVKIGAIPKSTNALTDFIESFKSLDLGSLGADIQKELEGLVITARLELEQDRLDQIKRQIETEFSDFSINLGLGKEGGDVSFEDLKSDFDFVAAVGDEFKRLKEEAREAQGAVGDLGEEVVQALRKDALKSVLKDKLEEADAATLTLNATTMDLQEVLAASAASSELLGESLTELGVGTQDLEDIAAGYADKLEAAEQAFKDIVVETGLATAADTERLSLAGQLITALEGQVRKYEEMAAANVGVVREQEKDVRNQRILVALMAEREALMQRVAERGAKIEALGGGEVAIENERKLAEETKATIVDLTEQINKARREGDTQLLEDLKPQIKQVGDIIDSMPLLTKEAQEAKGAFESIRSEVNRAQDEIDRLAKQAFSRLQTEIKKTAKLADDIFADRSTVELSDGMAKFANFMREAQDEGDRLDDTIAKIVKQRGRQLQKINELTEAREAEEGSVDLLNFQLKEANDNLAQLDKSLATFEKAKVALKELVRIELEKKFKDATRAVEEYAEELEELLDMIDRGTAEPKFLESLRKSIEDGEGDITKLDDLLEDLHDELVVTEAIAERLKGVGVNVEVGSTINPDDLQAAVDAAKEKVQANIDATQSQITLFANIEDGPLKEAFTRFLNTLNPDELQIVFEFLAENDGDLLATIGSIAEKTDELIKKRDDLEKQLKSARARGDDEGVARLEEQLTAVNNTIDKTKGLFVSLADELVGKAIFGPLAESLERIREKLEEIEKDGLSVLDVFELLSEAFRGIATGLEALDIVGEKFKDIADNVFILIDSIGDFQDAIKKINAGELKGIGAALAVAGPGLGILGSGIGIAKDLFGGGDNRAQIREEIESRKRLQEALERSAQTFERSIDKLLSGLVAPDVAGTELAGLKELIEGTEARIAELVAFQPSDPFEAQARGRAIQGEIFNFFEQLEGLDLGVDMDQFRQVFDDLVASGESVWDAFNMILDGTDGLDRGLRDIIESSGRFDNTLQGAIEELNFFNRFLGGGAEAVKEFATNVLENVEGIPDALSSLLGQISSGDLTAGTDAFNDAVRQLAEDFVGFDFEELGGLSGNEFTDIIAALLGAGTGEAALSGVVTAMEAANQAASDFANFVSDDPIEALRIWTEAFLRNADEIDPALQDFVAGLTGLTDGELADWIAAAGQELADGGSAMRDALGLTEGEFRDLVSSIAQLRPDIANQILESFNLDDAFRNLSLRIEVLGQSVEDAFLQFVDELRNGGVTFSGGLQAILDQASDLDLSTADGRAALEQLIQILASGITEGSIVDEEAESILSALQDMLQQADPIGPAMDAATQAVNDFTRFVGGDAAQALKVWADAFLRTAGDIEPGLEQFVSGLTDLTDNELRDWITSAGEELASGGTALRDALGLTEEEFRNLVSAIAGARPDLVEGLGVATLDDAFRNLSLRIDVLGQDLTDALAAFVKDVKSSGVDLSNGLDGILNEAANLDLSTEAGREQLKVLIDRLAEGIIDESISDEQGEGILNTLQDLLEQAETDEGPGFSRSVQIARTITEIQANEVITLLNESSFWLERIFGEGRLIREIVADMAGRPKDTIQPGEPLVNPRPLPVEPVTIDEVPTIELSTASFSTAMFADTNASLDELSERLASLMRSTEETKAVDGLRDSLTGFGNALEDSLSGVTDASDALIESTKDRSQFDELRSAIDGLTSTTSSSSDKVASILDSLSRFTETGERLESLRSAIASLGGSNEERMRDVGDAIGRLVSTSRDPAKLEGLAATVEGLREGTRDAMLEVMQSVNSLVAFKGDPERVVRVEDAISTLSDNIANLGQPEINVDVPQDLIVALRALSARDTLAPSVMPVNKVTNITFNQTFQTEQSIERILRTFEQEVRKAQYAPLLDG